MEENYNDPLKSTLIYDIISEKAKESLSNQATFRNFQKLIQTFADRNSDVLQTNIMGRQLLFSEDLQAQLLSLYNITKEDILQLINPKKAKGNRVSEYFKQFGGLSLDDQLCFLIPISIISALYLLNKKESEAEFIYMTMFFKPYASRISRYFKFGVNEPQMLYTIENIEERYDLKKEGSIINLIAKQANSSFNNYKKTLMNRPTDKDLYIIATAGCYTRVNSSIKNIFAKYSENKGKRLNFESSYSEVEDEDGGGTEEIENEIRTDAVVKKNVANKAIAALTKNPINIKYLKFAVQKAFAGSNGAGKFSMTHMRIMENAINEIIDKKFQYLPELIDCLLNAFIQQINPGTGKRYSATEIQTPVFIAASLRNVVHSPNSRDPNVIRARELVVELLSACSDDFLKFEKNSKRNIRNAFLIYLILCIRGS